MNYYLEKPALKHKKQAFAMLAAYLKADGGIEGCAALDCFLEDDNYEGWLENLTSLLNEPGPDFAPLEVFFFLAGPRIIGIVSIFHALLPKPHDWVGHLGYSIHPEERGRGRGVHLLNLAL